MITFRREHLDAWLEKSKPLMRGRVLDIGGQKTKKRGTFRPPLDQVSEWKYVNPDPRTEPDLVSGAEAIALPNEQFQTIVMTEVLEYVPNPRPALAEVHRLLAPGGYALISVPLHCPIHGDREQDLYRFTRSGLSLLLKEAGFREVEMHEMGGLGAILFDSLEAATGYAHPRPNALVTKIQRKVLYASVWFFRLLDSCFRGQVPYLTTGYFVKVRK